MYSVVPPLHDSDLFLRQPIQLIHQRVDLLVGGLDLARAQIGHSTKPAPVLSRRPDQPRTCALEETGGRAPNDGPVPLIHARDLVAGHCENLS